jgi:hypothetical protein
MMKKLPMILAPLFLVGCLTMDDVASLTSPYGTNPAQAGVRPSPSSYQSAYGDGYRQGYRAGFHDGRNGMGYRASSNYGGSSYNAAFSDGYYKGYAEGYHEGRRGYGYECAM